MVRDPTFRYEPALSWGAVWAGAFTALSISLLLTTLASGFGYALAGAGATSHAALTGFTPLSGALMVAGQCISAAFGGFVAGRLRHQWIGVHDDEAHFRDTAHGFLAWAVSTVAGVLIAALVLTPLADHVAFNAGAAAALSPADADRAAQIAAQAAFFTGVGMITAAFVAAVAGRLGGQQAEHFHAKAANYVAGAGAPGEIKVV